MPDDALRAVLTHLEVEGHLDDNQIVDRAEQVSDAVNVGVRVNEVLAIDREGRQDPSEAVGRSGAPQAGESIGSAKFRRLAQRLMLMELSRLPRVRAWRRKHLGGADATLTWPAADRWILENTWDVEDRQSNDQQATIYWSTPDAVLERTVRRRSAAWSLVALSRFLEAEAGWKPSDARKWILVGVAPPISEIRVSTRMLLYDLWPTVVLEASVWASARVVTRQFRAARSMWRSRRPAPKRKVVEMANFHLDNPGLSWRDCWEQWNEGHPEDQYSSSETMKRSYYALRDTLRHLRKMKPTPGRKRGAKS